MLKKLLLSTAFLTSLGALQDLYAQAPALSTFSVASDSCSTNPSQLYFVGAFGSVSNAVTGLSVTMYWGDGTSTNAPINFMSSQGWFNQSHNYALPGTYTAMAVLLDPANNALDTAQVAISSFCHTIYGRLYKRNDANCTFDYSVDDYLNIPEMLEVKKNNIVIDTLYAAGNFSYTVPNPDLVSEYSLHPVNNLIGYQLMCPGTAYKFRLDTLSMLNNHFDYGYDCNTSNTNFDLYTYMSGFLRFVNNSYLSINTGNIACTPASGVLTLNISPKYSYNQATIAPSSVSGQTLTWNLTNLSGSSNPYIIVTLNPVGTLTPGDTATSVVSITPTAGDVNTANNSFIFTDSISASLDPNDKKVIPAATLTAGQWLTYTINFENTGNDTAFNIHVIDTLSANLDAATFELVTSSHPVRTNVFDRSGSKILRFDFEDIKLADKDHPSTNKGFIIYKAKAKTNLVPGNEVANTAHIYFDINPAIVTNTVINKIPLPNTIEGLTAEDGINIYPNPAKAFLLLENTNDSYNRIVLVNTLGQAILSQNIRKGMNQVSLNELASGMYYLIISGKDNSKSIKITKE